MADERRPWGLPPTRWPSAAARSLALRAIAALGLDLAGVDIPSDESGRSCLIEVNGAVDFNTMYAQDVFAIAAAALVERAAARFRSARHLRGPARRGPIRRFDDRSSTDWQRREAISM